MKRKYVRPWLVGEEFSPNEFIAACGDSNTVYKFKCDAGGGVIGNVYLETNGEEGLQTYGRNSDEFRSGYQACGTTHEAQTTDEFLDGYYVTESRKEGTVITPVIVWFGPDNDNTHCTENLDMSTWETTKS